MLGFKYNVPDELKVAQPIKEANTRPRTVRVLLVLLIVSILQYTHEPHNSTSAVLRSRIHHAQSFSMCHNKQTHYEVFFFCVITLDGISFSIFAWYCNGCAEISRPDRGVSQSRDVACDSRVASSAIPVENFCINLAIHAKNRK